MLTILSFYVQAVPGVLHDTPVLEIGWSFCTINCVLLTTGAFLLFTCIRQAEAPRVVVELSNQLPPVPHAYFLARTVGGALQADVGLAHRSGHPRHRRVHVRLLLCDDETSVAGAGQPVADRITV